jgi:hypothetical protein
LALHYGHEASSSVSRGNMVCGRYNLDPVECSHQSGNGNPDENPCHCKDQHQFQEAKAGSHAAK